MSKTAIIFPGQGAQKVGMAQDLFNNNDQATEILTSAANTLDFDILETMFTDEEGKLGETENTQPALLTHSSALLAALKNLNPDFTMGHSLGEYSSLVAADVLSFEDAVKIVRKRGQLMAQAFPTGVGSMAAVLGLDFDKVDEICKSLSSDDKIIEPANINCPGQIVVSGHKALIDELVEKGKSLGAKRVMPLAVSGPFHSSLMKVIEEDFSSYINQFEWRDAKFPVVQNVNAQGETDKEVIKSNMVKQLYSPVQFINSTEWLIDQGVDHFIEIGPGKVLSGLIKKINRDVKLTSIQTLEDGKDGMKMTKSALVTGASRGIGRSIALQLAEEGYNVAVNYAGSKEKAEAVVEEIKAKGVDSFAIQANVADADEVKAMIKEVVSQFGSLDVLVNNAGITRDNLLMRMKEQEWDDVIDTNLKGVFNCIQKATPQMLRQRSGAIINLSSVVGAVGNPGQANYVATKAGVIGLTKSAARELASRGITVNAVAPGFIVSDMTDALSDELKEQMLTQIPLARFGQDTDIANTVAFLASDKAKYITGQTIHVNGGMYM